MASANSVAFRSYCVGTSKSDPRELRMRCWQNIYAYFSTLLTIISAACPASAVGIHDFFGNDPFAAEVISRAIIRAQLKIPESIDSDVDKDSFPFTLGVPHPDNGPPPHHVPYWDDAPLFAESVPSGDIGNKIVLKVRVLRYITSHECTTAREDHPIEDSRQTAPTTYAFAEVLSVEKGSFSEGTVMLCNANQPSERFSIGQVGLVFGTPSKNVNGRWRVIISETNTQKAKRKATESK